MGAKHTRRIASPLAGEAARGQRRRAGEEDLAFVSRSDLLRFTTAGSVDDGKSTLIGRLLWDCKSIYEDHLLSLRADSKRLNRSDVDLALLTDGLKAEREQGITIDVAYRHFATPRRRFIIADTPGHEQYTRNMATGASTAEVAVILVDARHGVLTQSKRHGFIAARLGIRHMALAVNKMDLVGWSRDAFERIRAEYSEFMGRLGVPDLGCIPMSALRGDFVVRRGESARWYRGPTLLSYLESVDVGHDRETGPFRFPVQSVLRPDQHFRGLAGRVASGRVGVGDEVVVLPSGRTSRVSSIHLGEREIGEAAAGQSVAVQLADDVDAGRGSLLAHPGAAPRVCSELAADLVWMVRAPLQTGRTYLVKLAAGTVRGEVRQVRHRVNPDDLTPEPAVALGFNETGEVVMRLHRPVPLDEYGHCRNTGCFILIDPITNETMAGGMVRTLETVQGPCGPSPAGRALATETSLVTAAQRERLLHQRGATVWLTGLSGSGKSTIAKALERRLVERGHACFVLDGDNVRQGLNRDLGFSPGDRAENIRRVAEVAALMNDAGLIVITAFISPYEEDRQRAGEIIGAPRFVEVYVDAALEECERRDPKGLYRKARLGAIPEFTGVSAPYEAPRAPALRLDTQAQDVEACVELVVGRLRERGMLGQARH